MSINGFKAATSIIESMRDGPQYVRVISGPRTGTIGRIVKVTSKYYSVHDYHLSVEGRRSFKMKGSELELISDHQGGTCHKISHDVPVYNDLMGRPIEIDHVILFPKSTEGAKVDMVIGTVKRISKKGAIYVRMFHKSQSGDIKDDLVRVGKPTSAMIIDKGTVDQVLLAKLMA